MKNLLILVLSLFTLLGHSQIKVDTTKVHVATELQATVQDFIDEGKKRGFFLTGYIVKKIDLIGFFKEFDDNYNGFNSTDYRSILLNPDVLENPTLLKLTVYHEIGHSLTRSAEHTCHRCNKIMSQHSPNTKDDYEWFENDDNWKDALDEYFEWLDKNAS